MARACAIAWSAWRGSPSSQIRSTTLKTERSEMKDKPSEYFIGAILRGYLAEKAAGKSVTPNAIWDHICMECLRERGFERMFEWDTRKARQNRIGTIMEVIEQGWVPVSGGKRLEISYCGGKAGRVVIEADDEMCDLPGVVARHSHWSRP
jgi:hypothetical protein